MSNEPGEVFIMIRDASCLFTGDPHEDRMVVCIVVLMASCKIIEQNDLFLSSLDFYIGT